MENINNEQNFIPLITVENRLGFYCRITDHEKPVSEWTFDEMYETWTNINYFKELIPLGKITVCYDGQNFIDFEPDILNGNRHEALVLSAFVASDKSKSRSHISCRHEQGGEFKALFEYISPTEIHYTNASGKVVRICFDSSKQSQIHMPDHYWNQLNEKNKN